MVVALVAIVILSAGYWSSRPPPGPALTTIVFATRVSDADTLAAALSVGDSLAGFHGEGVVSVTGVTALDAAKLYARGALFVSHNATAAGCSGWSR